MNKAIIALLAAMLFGKPILKAQNKTTVVTVKGDTLLKTVIKTQTLSNAEAMAKYYKDLEAWKDTVNILVSKHQQNPAAGELVLPPAPSAPTEPSATEMVKTTSIGKPYNRSSKSKIEPQASIGQPNKIDDSSANGSDKKSGDSISNIQAPTIPVPNISSPSQSKNPKVRSTKKKVVLNGAGDTLYIEQTDFDANGEILNQNIRIIEQTIDVKEISDMIKKEIEEAKKDLHQNNSNQTEMKIELIEPPVTGPIHFKTRPEPVTHAIRVYYGLNSIYGYSGDFFSMDALPAVPTSDQLPELKRAGSDHIGVESLWGFNLIRGRIRFYSGFRYDNYDYNFQNTTTLLKAGAPVFTNLTMDPNFSANPNQIQSKLSTHYFSVPVAIGIEPRHRNNGIDIAHIRVGINNQFLANSYLRTRFKDKSKNKVVDDFNLNDFLFSPFVHIEYGDMGIYVNYSLTNIFKETQAVGTRLLTIGLSLNLG